MISIKKAQLFTYFFADQCSLICNSELPSKFEYLTQSHGKRVLSPRATL